MNRYLLAFVALMSCIVIVTTLAGAEATSIDLVLAHVSVLALIVNMALSNWSAK